MLEQFSAAIDKLYSAATDRRRWPDALASIEDLTGSAGAVIGFVPKGEGFTGFNLAGRFTDEQCAIYSATYQPICRRTRYMIEHPEFDAIYDSLLISESEMNRDPVYDWFGQHGLRYFVGGSLPATSQFNVVWSLQRSSEQGHAQRKDIELFRALAPHVARAITLADHLDTLRSYNQFTSNILEMLPQSVFALDEGGRLLFANGSARALLSLRDGLSVDSGHLVTAAISEQRLLDALFHDAVAGLGQANSGWARISRPSGRPSYAVFASALRGAGEELTATRASVLVVVHEMGGKLQPDADMLRSVYALTDAEARLASAIGGGHSLESAAASLHIRPSTARTHLKAVFRKAGVNRQQDLVRMLARLSIGKPAT